MSLRVVVVVLKPRIWNVERYPYCSAVEVRNQRIQGATDKIQVNKDLPKILVIECFW